MAMRQHVFIKKFCLLICTCTIHVYIFNLPSHAKELPRPFSFSFVFFFFSYNVTLIRAVPAAAAVAAVPVMVPNTHYIAVLINFVVFDARNRIHFQMENFICCQAVNL